MFKASMGMFCGGWAMTSLAPQNWWCGSWVRRALAMMMFRL